LGQDKLLKSFKTFAPTTVNPAKGSESFYNFSYLPENRSTHMVSTAEIMKKFV
jgi:hypothetical protein